MRRYIWPTITLIIAAGIQGSLPGSITVLGAKPDLILVVLIAYSLAADPTFGAALGFVAGLIHGAAVGMSLGSFIITRTITGFLAGQVPTRLFSENPIVAVLSAAWLTLVCEALFLLANPRPHVFATARTVVGECIYNAILTLVVYFLLRHFETRHKIKLADARI